MNIPSNPTNIANQPIVSASDLFAVSQASINWYPEDENKPQKVYPDRCHWCGSPCQRHHMHDDPPALPFTPKNRYKAKCPSTAYVCHSCYLWKRPRVTIYFLDGTLKDVQCAQKHSWYITKDSAKAIRKEDRINLYPILLKPENTFVLSLLDGKEKIDNFLHLNQLNDIAEIKGNTELKFTLNNVVFTYTIYDLESALRNSEVGKTPGVRTLIEYCGPYSIPPLVEKEHRRGAPVTRGTGPLDTLRREIRMSGGGD